MATVARKYDLVLFGASGFTGELIVDELARCSEKEELKWAVAGRSMSKIQQVLAQCSARTGKDLKQTPVIIADTSDSSSLEEMAKQARIVLSAVGPFRFYGEPVVKACIAQGAHYLDVCGEPQFLETMQLKYHTEAKEKGVLVIGAAGFDCIPAEAGFMYTKNLFEKGKLTGVEDFLQMHLDSALGSVNYATYESAIHSFANWRDLTLLRKKLFSEPMPKMEHRVPRRAGYFYSEEVNKWCVPFMGCDKSCVYRTVRDHLNTGVLKDPVDFAPYLCVSSWFNTMLFVIFGYMFGLLANLRFGRWLLLTFPGFFSCGLVKRGGQPVEQLAKSTLTMTFVGYGFDSVDDATAGGKPNRRVMVRLTAPEAYKTTAHCVVQCVMILLREAATMHHKSGVVTPGAAYQGTSLLTRLERNYVKIATVSDTVTRKCP